MGDQIAENTGSAAFRRGTFRVRLFAADLFRKSDRRSLCAGYFVRRKVSRGDHNDRFPRKRDGTLSSWGMVAAAFLGSLLAMGFVLLVSVRVHDMSMLVVCGIMIGYICSAITDFCVTFADDSNIVNLHNWSLGSFSGMTWQSVRLMAVLVLLGVCVSFLLAKPISAYQMGEAYARNMGVRIGLLRVLLILLSSILSACVTAFAGPISFVGIAVPHLVKTLTKTATPLLLIPGCFLGGAVITLFCDGIARTVFAPTEISISSVTAVLLVPVVLVMMLKKRRGSL